MRFTKKFIGLALFANMLGLSFLPALAVEFSDIKQDYWAYQPIQALLQKNILSGYSDNSFKAESPVTRAEFSAMLVKSLQKDNIPISGKVTFRDVPVSFWAYDYIQRAYELGLVKGFPDNNFKPYTYITKAEVLAILSSAAKADFMTKMEALGILDRFYDNIRVPDWAIIPDAQAIKSNLAINYPQPNFLLPEKRVSRAETAAMLYNLRKNIGLESSAAITSSQNKQHVSVYVQKSSVNVQENQPLSTVEQVSQYTANGAISNTVLSGSIATIEVNSIIPATVETPFSSELAKVGDKIVLRIKNNIVTNQGTLLIPSESAVEGKITNVVSSKYRNSNARMNIDFNTITLPSGQVFPLKASVATETGMLEAGSLRFQILKDLSTNISAKNNTKSETIINLITNNHKKGVIYGTDIGGRLGLVGAALARGGTIEIPSGETLFIKLIKPLSINLRSGEIISQI